MKITCDGVRLLKQVLRIERRNEAMHHAVGFTVDFLPGVKDDGVVFLGSGGAQSVSNSLWIAQMVTDVTPLDLLVLLVSCPLQHFRFLPRALDDFSYRLFLR